MTIEHPPALTKLVAFGLLIALPISGCVAEHQPDVSNIEDRAAETFLSFPIYAEASAVANDGTGPGALGALVEELRAVPGFDAWQNEDSSNPGFEETLPDSVYEDYVEVLEGETLGARRSALLDMLTNPENPHAEAMVRAILASLRLSGYSRQSISEALAAATGDRLDVAFHPPGGNDGALTLIRQSDGSMAVHVHGNVFDIGGDLTTGDGDGQTDLTTESSKGKKIWSIIRGVVEGMVKGARIGARFGVPFWGAVVGGVAGGVIAALQTTQGVWDPDPGSGLCTPPVVC